MNEKSFKSTCCYCGVGCGIIIKEKSNGTITVEGDTDHPVNKGMLCSKGMNLHYTVMDKSDRLLHPQMRSSRNMPLQQVSWDDALNRSAAIFKTFIDKFGPQSVGFYVSGQCLTEEYYLVNKLMKGFIGANNIDTNSRLCMSSAVVGYNLSLGEDAVPVCYDDIELSDVILVEGANPAWCHPIIWRRVEAHKTANPHVKIIVVDPRKTQTVNTGDLHLDINPGTDVALNHAIGRLLINNNTIDFEFIKNSTEGFEAYKTVVFERTIAEYAQICGISVSKIETAAQWIGSSKGFLTMWTMGLNQSVIGVNKNLSLINLSLITGKIGKPGSGPFSLTGQPNAMGGREVGGLANMLASHRSYLNPAHRQEMQTFWGGGAISEKPGLTATEMFKALASGEMKAIWIVCTNPLVSMPDSNLIEKALKNAKLVIVQDISNRSDTLKFADIVLPAAAWTEKDGTMTNAERRISYLNKIAEPPSEALADTEIICKFADKMGWGKSFNYPKTEDIYNEYINTTENTNIDVSGLSYSHLQTKGTVQWPFTQKMNAEGNSLGTKRLFENHQFYTASKKAQIHAVPDQNQSEPISEDFPLVLLTGRIRDQWHTMTKTGRVNKLNQHINEPFVEINPEDAQKRDITDGDIVLILGNRGEAKVKAKITEEVKPGNCFMPMHWGRILGKDFARANNITNSLADPKSKEPDFKFSAVEIEKYQKPIEKIIVIGAGSASLGFISAYRKLNQTDEIEVFSKEIYPFYNRVMLPDYVSGTQTWNQLVKLREDQFEEQNITVNKGIEIVHIDKKNKILTDSLGKEHSYDKLFLGMGSRAFMPKNFPQIPGIFNMRSRIDADSLAPFIEQGGHAVVVGGGLLGLEMAASLREINLQVTIVQRISRLMDRQLDLLGSAILHEEIIAKGIDVFYNDEVEQFYGTEKIEGIRLKSGRKINCNALLVAAGTIPVIDLAKDATLLCNRGVIVNDYLQTSDPDIFACGEIAEWNNQMWGISAAAEQQAEIVANFLAGNLASFYKGSLSLNILKMSGLDICSLGEIEIPNNNEEGYEEVVFIDKAKHYYKKCVIKNDKLVGAILMGDKSEFLEFKNLISNGIELSDKRLQLLRSGKKPEPILGKLVCSCNNVGEINLQNCFKNQAKDFETVCQITGAGTGCGSCRPEIRAILEACIKKEVVLDIA
jgi:ferredoxin-nitrate reductase